MIITLRTPLLQKDVDLELPGDVETQLLLPELVRALQLPTTDNSGKTITYQLIRHKRRRPLRPSESLSDAGISTGDRLSLTSSSPQRGIKRGPSYQNTSALLRSPSGMVFALDNYGKQELTLGRYDARTGESPDIDLSEEPNGNTVSRPHALLRQQGAQWMLIPVSTKNPTTIDGIQIPQGRPHPLHHGNVITLGDVDLIFETSP